MSLLVTVRLNPFCPRMPLKESCSLSNGLNFCHLEAGAERPPGSFPQRLSSELLEHTRPPPRLDDPVHLRGNVSVIRRGLVRQGVALAMFEVNDGVFPWLLILSFLFSQASQIRLQVGVKEIE